MSNDAASCYNRILHAVASLLFQAMGIGISAIAAMLIPIQKISLYLHRGFRALKSAMGGTDETVMQGMHQGNMALPATWELLCT